MEISDHVEQESPGVQLIRAINSEDFERVKTLVSADVTILDTKDSCNDSMLHLAVRKYNLQILEYILSFERIDVNSVDSLGWTPLRTATVGVDYRILKILIEKGAHLNLKDEDGNTVLHHATSKKLYYNCKVLLERGANVNAQNNDGIAVLHQATCFAYASDLELIALLMCYGADVSIRLHGELGHTAFEFAVMFSKVEIPTFLSDFVFDNEKISIVLSAFAASMKQHSPIFYKLVDNVSRIVYDSNELQRFLREIPRFKSEYFEIFLQKFGYVLESIHSIDNDEVAKGYYRLVGQLDAFFIDNIYLMFSEPYASYFVDYVNLTCTENVISALVRQYKAHKDQITPEMLSEIIFHVLSYGVDLTDEALDKVFYALGDCETFRLLLHMDVVKGSDFAMKLLFPRFIYDTDLRDINATFRLTKRIRSDFCIKFMFGFFGGVAFKEWCGQLQKYRDKVKKVPDLQSLLELARNAARNHIIKYYAVTTSRQLYTVMQRLPINNEYKNILSFKKKIYALN